MDCGTVRERAVAWLEGELGRAEAGQVEAHLERCPRCADFVAALDGQRPALRALRAAGEAAAAPPPGGWAQMDAALDAAFAAEAARPAPPPPAPAGRWALSPWGALAYAAALVLALGWGWWQRQEATAARARLAEVQATLEREQRLGAGGAAEAPPLGAVPALAVPAGSLQPAAYTPQRSTF